MNRFGCVVLVDRRGWILLQERDEHPVIDPETWSLSGGHLEEGEDPAVGATRELAEETGIVLTPSEVTPVGDFDVFHQAYGSLDRLSVFAAATALADEDVILGEGRQIVFVEPGRALQLELSAAARIVVPTFLASTLYADLAARARSA
ncbi:MAG: NUDIX domain-containing protein [Actinobacteria bacterium]|uniref:Unannotated protein n=1 Tax=freshwater metagenome TaxID=449393 RepID=A0A6J6PGG4_9ZZZZ|nr:NUDIX domain-containing protein [Actinomycetota bacterium]